MPMPSLVKYFAFVGAGLLALISLANFLLEPSTGATAVQAAAKPAAPVVRHEPGASKIERWRNEQAALKAAEQSQSATNASVAAKSIPEPLRPGVVETAPVQQAAVQAGTPAPQLQTASVQSGEPDQAAEQEAARLKAERAKAAKAAKAARQARLARERARAEQAARASGQFFFNGGQQRTASNQQDAFYYGQRPQQQQPQVGYAYASRPNFGPFGWSGRGW